MKNLLSNLDNVDKSLHELNVVFVNYIKRYKDGIDLADKESVQQLVSQFYRYNIINKKLNIRNIDDIIDKISKLIYIKQSDNVFMKIECIYDDSRYNGIEKILIKAHNDIDKKCLVIIAEYILEYLNGINKEALSIDNRFMEQMNIDSKYRKKLLDAIQGCVSGPFGRLGKGKSVKRITSVRKVKRVKASKVKLGALIYGSSANKKVYKGYKNFIVKKYSVKIKDGILKKLKGGINIQLLDNSKRIYKKDVLKYKDKHGKQPSKGELASYIKNTKYPASKYYVEIYRK